MVRFSQANFSWVSFVLYGRVLHMSLQLETLSRRFEEKMYLLRTIARTTFNAQETR